MALEQSLDGINDSEGKMKNKFHNYFVSSLGVCGSSPLSSMADGLSVLKAKGGCDFD